MQIAQKTSDPVINLALDTIDIKKQALIFVNAKRSAEKVAEDICKKSSLKSAELDKLSESVRTVLSKPTKQCERLAASVKRGIAFHHAGLAAKQKELIEDAFRSGLVKIICCTPTLAAGVDLPAFRSIIRDVRRFGMHGMAHIPVLEFLQMAGRAGRPKYDKFGETIVIAQTESDKEYIIERYLKGIPEDIYSKLAVEPVFRTYLLSLISARIISSNDSIISFFSKTFWAYQYRDIARMERIIGKTLNQLVDWGFLQEVNEGFRATMLGKRIAELYIDPLTAFNLLNRLEKATHTSLKSISLLHAVANTLEMRPLLSVKQREYDEITQKYALLEPCLLEHEPSMFEPEYEDWLDSIKTALMLEDWIDEKDEEWLLEKYDCRPGEARVKIDTADWLLYGCHELARIMQYQKLLPEITKVRLRLKYGVKEELLPLIRLEGIGRVRARKLFRAGIKDLGGIRKTSLDKLAEILGSAVAKSVKEQVGEA
ncbi:MAG: helicase-related protein [Candidatus Woesearchaeota archaeon]